ncbi:HopJ type III effector protein [Tenacibaculum geojense]|uniref:HopJ type III effector protein n=1 Tax=Tenacibaculum geojense TaxID=915352 RepID=A0ABW3JQF0_9FLAO
MTKSTFLQKLKTSPKNIKFSETIAVIENTYDFTPSSFKNGNMFNEETQNQGSCKVFSFALEENLSKEATLACFGEHYNNVLENPDGDDHQNIRNFMKTGFEGLSFENKTLT